MYDTVSQYDQVRGGDVTDWHPPVMVRLWQLLHPLAAGTAPMFVLQVLLYAVGWALIVSALGRVGRWRAALAAALLSLSPLLLGWQMVVLKDCQMQGAMIAAVGIVAHWRLGGRKVPLFAAVLVALLLAYATLVRANAVFATVPLAVLLLPRPSGIAVKAVAAVVAMLAILALSPAIDHRLFGASESGVAKSQALFDLAAIAVATPDPAPFTPQERAAIVRRHCVKAYFWDPLGDPTACGEVTERLNDLPEGTLYADLARSAAGHPVAYAEHRVRHWNSTERWLVQPNLPEAGPPDEDEANNIGLRTPPSPLMPAWQSTAAAQAGTPLGWPIVWTAVTLALIPAAWRRRTDPGGGLAFALVASSLTLEASFLVVSIASDMRYHLWSMTASALALILLADDWQLKRREWLAGAGLVALVVAGGVITRSTLPPAPSEYEEMVHASSG